EYESQKEILTQLKQTLQKEFLTIKELINLVPNEAMKAFVCYYQQNEDNPDSDDLQHHLAALNTEVTSYLQAHYAEKDKVEADKRDLSEQIRLSQTRLSQLRRHVKTYPFYVENLINTLNQELSNY